MTTQVAAAGVYPERLPFRGRPGSFIYATVDLSQGDLNPPPAPPRTNTPPLTYAALWP